MKRIIICLTISMFIIGCKKDKKETQIQEPVKVETSKIENKTGDIKLVVKARFSNPDKLEVFYREYDNSFTSQESLREDVGGDNIPQNSIFIVPNQTLAPHFRFDFGEREDQEVTILNIALEFNGKVFEIPQNKIMASFNSSDWVEIIDYGTAKIKPIKISDRVDPKLTFSSETVNEIIDFFNF